MLSFFLNAFLCFDLYNTVKAPFALPNRNSNNYIYGSIAIAIPIITYEAVKWNALKRESNLADIL